MTTAASSKLEKTRKQERATAHKLERTALTTYRTDWREDCEEAARPDNPDPAANEHIERRGAELGRRVRAHAARLLREARCAKHQAPCAKLDGAAATDPMSTTKTSSKSKKPLSEQTVRTIRRAYRPRVRLSKLQEQFGLTGGTITSVANRSTYAEYETSHDEYEPAPHIRGTRRREPPVTPAW